MIATLPGSDPPGADGSGRGTVTVLTAGKTWQPLDLAELWRYRELLWILAGRDIKVRYKQTVLGASWAILQPLLTMIVFTIFFGRLAHIPSDGIPYPVFTFCALLPWQLFSSSLNQAGNSLIGNQHLITKVYFPRLLIPVAAMGSSLLDFAISFVVLVVLMGWYGIVPGWPVVALPLFILFAVATALTVGLWLSALSVKYRDIRYTIPFLTQFWLFVTPIAYPSSLVPARWRWLYGLNPMTGVVEGFRWCLLGKAEAPGAALWVSALTMAVLLVGGVYYFRRVERTFADVV